MRNALVFWSVGLLLFLALVIGVQWYMRLKTQRDLENDPNLIELRRMFKEHEELRQKAIEETREWERQRQLKKAP